MAGCRSDRRFCGVQVVADGLYLHSSPFNINSIEVIYTRGYQFDILDVSRYKLISWISTKLLSFSKFDKTWHSGLLMLSIFNWQSRLTSPRSPTALRRDIGLSLIHMFVIARRSEESLDANRSSSLALPRVHHEI